MEVWGIFPTILPSCKFIYPLFSRYVWVHVLLQGLHFVRGQWITLLGSSFFIGRSLGWLCLCKMSLWSWWWVRVLMVVHPRKLTCRTWRYHQKEKEKHLDKNHNFLPLPAGSFQRVPGDPFWGGLGVVIPLGWLFFVKQRGLATERWGRTLSVTQEIRQTIGTSVGWIGFWNLGV